MQSSVQWFVYLVKCSDKSLYAGITTNLERRVQEHNGEINLGRGAKYTRTKRPVVLYYYEQCASRSEACRREAEIRKLSRQEKLDLAPKTI